MVKISKRFRKMLPVYQHFAREHTAMSFTEHDALEAFEIESYGKKPPSDLFRYKNGYYWGKKYLGLSVTSWREDLRNGYLDFQELLESIPVEIRWWFFDVFGDDYLIYLRQELRFIFYGEAPRRVLFPRGA